MILSRGPTLVVALSAGPAKATPPAPPSAAAGVTLFDAEREHLRQALQGSGWRIRGTGGAAEQLGIKPTTLESRMKKFGLRRPHAASNGS
jgi:formate hydrogenlyase transcriptional activator